MRLGRKKTLAWFTVLDGYAYEGWFTERNDLWPGQAMSLWVEEILHHKRS